MIAIKRLQSIMWILIVAVGALSAYLISLRVATERNAVKALEQRIYETRGNIRYLELEFDSRASLRQLEAWNVQDIRYSVPTAKQYLASERQLAMLDRLSPSGNPSSAPAVMTAMADQALPAKAAPPPASSDQAGFSLIKSAVAAEPAPRAIAVAAPAKAASDTRLVRVSGQPDPAAKRSARLALLDQKLLDAGTLRRIDDAESGKAIR